VPTKWRSYSKIRAKIANSDDGNLRIDESSTVETPQGDPIVRSLGDGARRSFNDHRENMGETHKYINYRIETTFYAKEETGKKTDSFLPPEKAHNRRWLYHNGLYSDDQGKREYKEKIAMTQALADELPITKWEQQSALKIILNLNMLQFNRIGGLEAGILGTLAFIRDSELSKDRFRSEDSGEIMSNRIVNSDSYQDLCEQFGVDYHDAVKKVKRVID